MTRQWFRLSNARFSIIILTIMTLKYFIYINSNEDNIVQNTHYIVIIVKYEFRFP